MMRARERTARQTMTKQRRLVGSCTAVRSHGAGYVTGSAETRCSGSWCVSVVPGQSALQTVA